MKKYHHLYILCHNTNHKVTETGNIDDNLYLVHPMTITENLMKDGKNTFVKITADGAWLYEKIPPFIYTLP